jgi:hypothetical protein
MTVTDSEFGLSAVSGLSGASGAGAVGDTGTDNGSIVAPDVVCTVEWGRRGAMGCYGVLWDDGDQKPDLKPGED